MDDRSAMKRVAGGAWIGGAAALLALLWLASTRPAASTRAEPASPAPPPPAASEPGHAATFARSAAPDAPTARAVPPGEGPGHVAHPITSEHLRIYREADLQHAALRALRSGRFEEARSVLADHRREYPERRHTDNAGLTALADCMQDPNPETRGRARRFYAEQTQSMLRRKIRQLCLTPDVRAN